MEFTWLGEEKIPEPIINPTINDNPFKYVNVLCFSKEPTDCPDAVGAPIGAYPPVPVVDESGKRLAAKSKVDETEYVRP